MKIIPATVNITTLEASQRIEQIGRVSHKSENLITSESAITFCADRARTGHMAIFGHGFVYFKFEDDVKYLKELCLINKFIKVSKSKQYIGLSYRTLIDLWFFVENVKSNNITSIEYFDVIADLVKNMWRLTSDLQKIFNLNITELDIDYVDAVIPLTIREVLMQCPEIYFVSFKFTCDRGISHELVRHISMCFLQESTRFCLYTKDKFNNELTVIDLREFIEKYDVDGLLIPRWIEIGEYIEQLYKLFTEHYKVPAQLARGILYNNLKTEVWVSATLSEWMGEIIECQIGDITVEERKGFLPQRLHSSAHPQMIPLAKNVESLIVKYYGKFIGYSI